MVTRILISISFIFISPLAHGMQDKLSEFISKKIHSKLHEFFEARGSADTKLINSLRAYMLYSMNCTPSLIAPHETNTDGIPFLIKAAERACPEIVEYFLHIGAHPDMIDAHKSTALIAAAKNIMTGYQPENALQILKLLLNAGANPNAQDFLGTTALMYLAHSHKPRHISVPVRLLIIHGARTDLRDCSGKTALDYCGKCEKFNAIQVWLGNKTPAHAKMSKKTGLTQ